MRSYVRHNALCRVGTEFDAKSRKIRRVAQPEADDDATNKLYVEERVKILRDQIVERLTAFEKDVHSLRTAISDVESKTEDKKAV